MNSTATKRNENNFATIVGTLVSNYEFSHEIFGEGFYRVKIQSERTSGAEDTLECIVSNRLADVTMDPTGERVRISGQFRSFNKRDEAIGHNRLILQVFVHEIESVDDAVADSDHIELKGFVCKEPGYRKTPLRREICDILIAVNRPYGKSDYIPVICWGRNARYGANLEVGKQVEIKGRIQSREYFKRDASGEKEATPRVAYEVSAAYISDKIEEDENVSE